MPRANPRKVRSAGEPDTGSRAKATAAAKRTNEQVESVDAEAWPRNPGGSPMVKILMTASELLPTGQYANVSVGPAQITAFIDPDAEEPFTDEQKTNMAKALNQLAEIVEADVVAVQRNIVLEGLQEATGSNGTN